MTISTTKQTSSHRTSDMNTTSAIPQPPTLEGIKEVNFLSQVKDNNIAVSKIAFSIVVKSHGQLATHQVANSEH